MVTKAQLEKKSDWYIELKPKWDRSEILYKGEDEVHKAGVLLMPKLAQQDAVDYKAYVERTRFLNAYKRTVKGLKGTVERKEASYNFDEIEDLINNIDGDGTTVFAYIQKTLLELLKIGICGTLVDHTDTDAGLDEQTIAEAEAAGHQPKLSFYKIKDVYKLLYKYDGKSVKLAKVVLHEVHIKEDEYFEEEEIEQFRVLRINSGGYYEQQLYICDEDGNIDEKEPIEVLFHGEKMDFIPFFIHGEFEEPPLWDLVTTNIKHYQLKGSHSNGLHFIGLPTPYRTGVDPNDTNLPSVIGPSVIWDIESDKAKVGYLEFEGKGMDQITGELDAIKEDMAFLGAAMLATDQMSNETATKATYRNASETSSLAELAINNSTTLTKALKLLSRWYEKKDESEVYFEHNTDFDTVKLTAQDILARVQAWQSGAFSKQSLYLQLKSGEVEMTGDTFEDEESLINGVGEV